MEPLLFNSGEAISWEKAEEWERTLLKWYKEKAKMKNLAMEEKNRTKESARFSCSLEFLYCLTKFV